MLNSVPFFQSVRSGASQETNLSSSRDFKVPGYSVFRADCTLTHRSPTTTGNQNSDGGGVLTLINSDLSFQIVPFPTLSDSTWPQTISVSKSLSPLNFPKTFILHNFNAHHPTWDAHVSPNSAGNSLFNWILSSQLDVLNDPDIYMLLHHSSSPCSSPDVSLAPSHLAPTCEWCTLPGQGSNYLPIDINL